ncbi:MAG TPA: methyltransferase domain-containing protein [Methanoregulaceae archaeon]|nr:MAG: methyltransferase domain-containing protein [Methanolinea sp.]HON81997.1 methyltransferase domain-containing protein [Methanoregulaceae archaeon]HPD10753.1 methyltransferase domain-containing protein [Methanoregulaceae archaeon]HRT15881.1 methyltransferase domain-containing protein [Methanoregulaceae archaeon]HRU77648.1 methyltransferase domain-containing protein [Rectinema sp.]
MEQDSNKFKDYASRLIKEYSRPFSFEEIHSHIRVKQALTFLEINKCNRILEIGGGKMPLFPYLVNFDQYVLVEPIQEFVSSASSQLQCSHRITIIRDFLENCQETLEEIGFDCIIANGVLHEVTDPRSFLTTVKTISHENTISYFSLPNAASLHRLLAKEMGLIKTIFEISNTDKKYHRALVYDKKSIISLMNEMGFSVIDFGTYFIKPFTNKQMEELIMKGIFDMKLIDGLIGLTAYLPEYGSEMYVIAKRRYE